MNGHKECNKRNFEGLNENKKDVYIAQTADIMVPINYFNILFILNYNLLSMC